VSSGTLVSSANLNQSIQERCLWSTKCPRRGRKCGYARVMLYNTLTRRPDSLVAQSEKARLCIDVTPEKSVFDSSTVQHTKHRVVAAPATTNDNNNNNNTAGAPSTLQKTSFAAARVFIEKS